MSARTLSQPGRLADPARASRRSCGGFGISAPSGSRASVIAPSDSCSSRKSARFSVMRTGSDQVGSGFISQWLGERQRAPATSDRMAVISDGSRVWSRMNSSSI